MLTATRTRCAYCLHPEAEHHPSMEWCQHRVGEAACCCEQFVPTER